MFSFGREESFNDLKVTNKELLKRVREYRDAAEEVEQEHADHVHNLRRSYELDIRAIRERSSDEIRRVEREAELDVEKCDKHVREAQAVRDGEISKLNSKIRDLELQVKERQTESDLEIQEGIQEFKEEHSEEIADLRVKVATLDGKVLAAEANGKSKDIVIEILKKQLDSRGEDMAAIVELAGDIAPKMDVDAFNFEVNVPVSAKTGGEQKKQN